MQAKNLVLFPFILIFYTIVTYLSNDLFLPALIQLMHDFHTSATMAQLTLTTWFLGAASTQLMMGPLSDHYGRRPILLLGAVLFIVSTIICALTHWMNLLLLARLIQGSAVCSLTVAGYATIHELYDGPKAIQVLALMGGIGILAPAFGPLLGGVILEIAGWRSLFWLLAVNAVLALIFLTRWMPESHPKEKRVPFQFKTIFWGYYLILKNKNFMLAALVLCLIYGGLIAWLTMGPLLITEAYHYSPLRFGFYQALIFSLFILGNLLIKPMMNYFSINKIIGLGLFLTLVSSILAFLVAYYHSERIIFFIITLMLFAFGAALQYGPLQRIAIEASQEPMGLRMAIFSSCLGLAGVFSSAISSYIYNETSIRLAYFLLIIAILAMIFNCFREGGDGRHCH